MTLTFPTYSTVHDSRYIYTREDPPVPCSFVSAPDSLRPRLVRRQSYVLQCYHTIFVEWGAVGWSG